MSLPRDVDRASALTPLRAAKQAMRAQVSGARDALDPALRVQASQAIARTIASLPAYDAATVLLVTLPFRSEWDTRPLVACALAAGKTVAVPRVDAAARMLALHELRDPVHDVVAGHMGIPEPRPTLPPVRPEAIALVVVPGVAFDPQGGRLGYGGGYYDRLLPLVPASAMRVAGAFEIQLVPAVPSAAHDATVDAIATERRLIVTRSATP